MYTPNVRKESVVSNWGTVDESGDCPEVSSISPGADFLVVSLEVPFFQTHAMRYQKLFCMFIAPLVEKVTSPSVELQWLETVLLHCFPLLYFVPC